VGLVISVAKVGEPAEFDLECRKRGLDWITNNPGKLTEPRDFWSPFRTHLRNGFNGLCGYAAMLCPTGGTVDHFISVRNDPTLIYEWGNYRYASGTMNGIKRNKDAKVLDPYLVPEGWFEIILPSLQMKVTSSVPASDRDKAEYMLDEMRLGDDERIIEWRQSYYELYQRGELTLDGLRRVAPLIAEAVERQLAVPHS